MNKRHLIPDRIRFQTAYFMVSLLLFFSLCSAAFGVTVTVAPQNINVSQGMSNSLQIFYQAYQIDVPTFSAISSQGRFETQGGGLIGTINTTIAIPVVNFRGSAAESVVIPAAVIREALEQKLTRIFYRRTFIPSISDLPEDTSEVQLQIVPSSAAQFSFTRMELLFNRPDSEDTTRPASGGRITVPRNTHGLTATARLAYTGSGTFRGQWKVDGQVLESVTRPLTAGISEISVTSQVTPGFPTYATGLHRVEFEIIDPVPGFAQPVLFYYVSDVPPGPSLGSLRLITPVDHQHVRLHKEMLPVFSWEPVRNGVVYHFQIYGLETPAAVNDLSRVAIAGHKPLVAALTQDTVYRISIFDVDRIVPGIPYIWQVKAYDGNSGVAASLSRVVYFTPVTNTVLPAEPVIELTPEDADKGKP